MSKRKRRKHVMGKADVDIAQQSKYVPTDKELESTIQKSKWGRTRLTSFLPDAHKNTLITYLKQPGYFEMLNNLGELLDSANVCLTYSDSDLSTIVIVSLFGRACGNFFAAVSLATSGQLTESYAQLRVCIENAFYASYIKSQPSLAKVWGDRHQSDQSKKKCIDSFRIGDMIRSLESQNLKLGQRAKKEYDTCIDFGAHPNERSVIPNLKVAEGCPLKLQLLNVDPGLFGACLLSVVLIVCANAKLSGSRGRPAVRRRDMFAPKSVYYCLFLRALRISSASLFTYS